MYEPRLGRFTQVDPVLENRSNHHYSYGLNDPVSKVDPFGLQYKISKDLLEKYPVLKNAIQSAYHYIKEGKTEVTTGGFGRKEAVNLFEYGFALTEKDRKNWGAGKGPELHVGETQPMGGHTEGTKIIIDEKLVKMANEGDLKAQELLEAVILHESAHAARNQTGVNRFSHVRDEGEEVERRIFGGVKGYPDQQPELKKDREGKPILPVKGKPLNPYNPKEKAEK